MENTYSLGIRRAVNIHAVININFNPQKIKTITICEDRKIKFARRTLHFQHKYTCHYFYFILFYFIELERRLGEPVPINSSVCIIIGESYDHFFFLPILGHP